MARIRRAGEVYKGRVLVRLVHKAVTTHSMRGTTQRRGDEVVHTRILTNVMDPRTVTQVHWKQYDNLWLVKILVLVLYFHR